MAPAKRKKKNRWYANGIQFTCQGSGNCCRSRGQHGYVFLTLNDRRRMATKLGLSTVAFTKRYCSKKDGSFHLIEEPGSPECIFLVSNRCSIYEARPTQCRTWPFWPEHMGAKAWKSDVASFCPGIGKGKLISAEEIEETLRIQKAADREE